MKKYEAVVRRYAALQERNEKRVLRQSASSVFALAAQRSPVTGIAFLRGGVIHARNKRFGVLAQGDAGWRRSEGAPVVPNLDRAVFSAVARLGRAGTEAVLERYERVGSDQVIDVRVERLGAGSIDSSCVMATLVDVSELVRAARQLEDARKVAFEQERFRTMGELTSGFAHDFNNTLNAMNLWVARLGQSPHLGAAERRALDALKRIVGDAAVRVGQLQDFSRSRSDVPEESLSISEVVGAAVELFRTDVEGRALEPAVSFRTETSFQRDLPAARGSSSELRSVFLNLLLNARDAMPRGGTTAIDARREDDHVVVTVEDQGTGIPEEHLARVFDPCFTTKGKRGTGLGLSIAYRVMQRLGGSISAANGPLGGALFRLVFPLAPAPQGAPPPAVLPSPPAAKRVLVVDDDEDNLEAMRMVLEGLGQTVTTAPSGASALDHARHTRFDLVLCDLRMPGLNGWEVADGLRKRGGGTPVYVVTGGANEIPPDDPHRTLVAGVLPKPLELEKLAQLLGAQAGEPSPPRAMSPD